jgi:hypothetical protein
MDRLRAVAAHLRPEPAAAASAGPAHPGPELFDDAAMQDFVREGKYFPRRPWHNP